MTLPPAAGPRLVPDQRLDRVGRQRPHVRLEERRVAGVAWGPVASSVQEQGRRISP